MATLQELEQALINADAAGNVADAEKLANAIAEIKASQQPPTTFNEPFIPDAQSLPDRAINHYIDSLKSTGSGLAKAGAGIASLPGLVERGMTYIPGFDQGILKDLIGTDWGEQSIGKAKSGKYIFPGYEDITRNLSAVGAGPALDYEPQSAINRYRQTGAEWGAGGLLSKPSAIPKMVSTAGGAGLFSQGVEDLTGSETGGAVAGLASLLPLTLLSNVGRSNAPKMLQAAFGKLDETQQQVLLSDAKAFEKWATEIGIPLTGAESVGTEGMLKLLDLAGQNRYGAGIIDDFVSKRVDHTRQAVARSLDDIGTQPTSKKEWAEKIQLIADDYITKQKNIRTKMSQSAGYTAADTELVSPSVVNNILKSIDDAMTSSKAGEPVYQALSRLKNRLISEPASKSKIVDVGGKTTTIPPKPEIRMNILDGINKDLKEVLELSTSSGAKDAVKKIVRSQINPIVKEVDNVLLSNPNFAQARKVFQAQSELVTNIVEKNISAFNKAGIKPTTIVRLVFDPDNINANDVRKISKILNDADPNAFSEISRMWLSNSFEGAVKRNVPGIPLSGGSKYANKVFSGRNSEQRQVFMAMLDGVADAKGLNFSQAKDFKVGMDRLMRVLQRTGKLPASNSATYQRQQMAEIAGRSTGGEVASMISAKPLESTRRWLSELMEKRTMEELARVFTSPNSIDEIIKLSKMSPKLLERLVGDTSRTVAITSTREAQQATAN